MKCPKCKANDNFAIERSPDGKTKCLHLGCGFEAKHIEFDEPRLGLNPAVIVAEEILRKINQSKKKFNFLEAFEINKVRPVVCCKNRGFFDIGEMIDEEKNEHWGLGPILSDWEIYEEKVEITREHFDAAWTSCNGLLINRNELAKKLGFK